MTIAAAIAAWHAVAQSGDADAIGALLNDDAVFESPVVHTPQRGRAISTAYLAAAGRVFAGSGFRYGGEWRADDSAVLEFSATIADTVVNGVDMIWWDADWRIIRFKVMVRPLRAVNVLHARMAAMLTG